MHGFMHPLSGLDHQLAMILVGRLRLSARRARAAGSCRSPSSASWRCGGFLGVAGIPVPFVEIGIALLGDRARRRRRLRREAPLAVAMGAVGSVRHLPRARPRLRDAAGCLRLRIRDRLHARHRGAAWGRHLHRLAHRRVRPDARNNVYRLAGVCLGPRRGAPTRLRSDLVSPSSGHSERRLRGFGLRRAVDEGPESGTDPFCYDERAGGHSSDDHWPVNGS